MNSNLIINSQLHISKYVFLLPDIAMETLMAKWFMESNKKRGFEDHAILLTLQMEEKATIGISTQDKDIQEMIETFTKNTHVYQLTGFDEHEYFVSQPITLS